MFCLRSWLATLVFLSGLAPAYVVLFLIAHYSLQRPCVYCSILLFVLIFSLFDFRTNWFEPRWQPSSEQLLSMSETLGSFVTGNATFTDAVLETATLAVSAVNGAVNGTLAGAAMEGVKRKVGAGGGVGNVTNGFEVLRSVVDKWQFRIPCLDVVVRL